MLCLVNNFLLRNLWIFSTIRLMLSLTIFRKILSLLFGLVHFLQTTCCAFPKANFLQNAQNFSKINHTQYNLLIFFSGICGTLFDWNLSPDDKTNTTSKIFHGFSSFSISHEFNFNKFQNILNSKFHDKNLPLTNLNHIFATNIHLRIIFFLFQNHPT